MTSSIPETENETNSTFQLPPNYVILYNDSPKVQEVYKKFT